MYNSRKFLVVGGLILIIISSWVYGIRSWFFSDSNPAKNDVAVKAADQWVKMADSGVSESLAALTRKAGFEKFMQRYKADTESLGMVSRRKFLRRSSYSSKLGQLVVAEFQVWFSKRKWPISEKIFMLESKKDGKASYTVIDARYIVRLPRLYHNGSNYEAESDSSSGDPVALAQKWFESFDHGKLERCSYITYPQICFSSGRFFFDLARAPVDYKFFEHLKKMYAPGRPRKRVTLSKLQWNGIPGASKIQVFCLTSKASYDKFSRIERVWAYKDCYHSDPQWLLYSAQFSKPRPYKKKSKSKKKTGKK